MSRVVLTGATGFIGRHLLQYLAQDDALQILIVVRRPVFWPLPKQVSVAVLADFRDEPAWTALLQPDDLVIHLAGLAHRDLPAETQVEGFFEANVATTRALAKAAHQRHIRQFIFISSIGVYGSSREDVLTVDSALHPDQPYAESKLAAELALLSTAGRTYPCTILRLPLVYGADSPGNFGRLLRLVASGVPLPFAALTNRKSFLSVTTLNEIVLRLLRLPANEDHILIAAEPEAVSLPTLLESLAAGMGKKPTLFYLPLWMLKAILTLAGQKKMFKKLCLTLEADCTDLYQKLQWRPSTASTELIKRIGAEFKEKSGK